MHGDFVLVLLGFDIHEFREFIIKLLFGNIFSRDTKIFS